MLRSGNGLGPGRHCCARPVFYKIMTISTNKGKSSRIVTTTAYDRVSSPISVPVLARHQPSLPRTVLLTYVSRSNLPFWRSNVRPSLPPILLPPGVIKLVPSSIHVRLVI